MAPVLAYLSSSNLGYPMFYSVLNQTSHGLKRNNTIIKRVTNQLKIDSILYQKRKINKSLDFTFFV